ncbi:MAG: hypothetical protein COZ46_04725 [Verrucomicrobia bacterium CG_4_10_14_3_um_filter_43_23]|nr:MAG: hypothetical protein AUJ82_08400 [Verrucomicrobia bacterium CG1_02_43_26]PIP59909.1 MAG: hypothetical protein COX01_00760 [Verrucomicrobia bacterium CG22_combo_CG10-13_8_21_14_all_43_17]PIX58249.1 MAG: hypothetical protein COZ46_04725 [Verrucomicrobia bacterium CG_4_10_14_3_um_filter_43_23]PIY62435.1 MAG: hypothetical protein COY94_02035 [Verrucomicrobia bacterium CG_4_10_14_0_8_um_filter_43_34]PJA44441.1 MAG: hypothetical protein CO175_02660 [Verrucomicrobia bacterium CG_4_9_14_3_um_fi
MNLKSTETSKSNRTTPFSYLFLLEKGPIKKDGVRTEGRRAPILNIIEFLDDKKDSVKQDIQSLLSACHVTEICNIKNPERFEKVQKTLPEFQIIYLTDIRRDTFLLMFTPVFKLNKLEGYRVDIDKFNELWNKNTNNNVIKFKPPKHLEKLPLEGFIKNSHFSDSLTSYLDYKDSYAFLAKTEAFLCKKVGNFCAGILLLNQDFPHLSKFLHENTKELKAILENAANNYNDFQTRKRVAIKLNVTDFADLKKILSLLNSDIIGHLDKLDKKDAGFFFDNLNDLYKLNISDLETIEAYISLSEEEQKYFLENHKSINLPLLLSSHALSKNKQDAPSIKIYEAVIGLKEKKENLTFVIELLLEDINKIEFEFTKNKTLLKGAAAITAYFESKEKLQVGINKNQDDFLKYLNLPNENWLLQALVTHLKGVLGEYGAGCVLLNMDIPNLTTNIHNNPKLLQRLFHKIKDIGYENFHTRKSFLITHNLTDWNVLNIILFKATEDAFNFISKLDDKAVPKALRALKIIDERIDERHIQVDLFTEVYSLNDIEFKFLEENKNTILWLFFLANNAAQVLKTISTIDAYKVLSSFHESFENFQRFFELGKTDFQQINFKFSSKKKVEVGIDGIKEYLLASKEAHQKNCLIKEEDKYKDFLSYVVIPKGNISKVLNIFLTKSNFAAFTIPVILLNTDIPNLCQYLWDDSKRDKESRELDNLLSNFKNNYESFLYKKNLVIKYQVKDFSTFKTVMLDLTKDESDYLEKNDNVNLLRFLELRLKATHDISTMKLYEDDLLLQNSVIEDYL